MRATALSICGSRNGSASELRRGRRKFSISSFVAKPLRKSRRAMQSAPQISVHEIGPPFSSSGGSRIHRLCTDYSMRGRYTDKLADVEARVLTRKTPLAQTVTEETTTSTPKRLGARNGRSIIRSIQFRRFQYEHDCFSP